MVGFATGGIPDMVMPGHTGLLAKQNDIVDLASKIKWMIEHKEECEKMGRKACKKVEREFALEQQRDAYMALYRNIVK